jgi:Ca2+-binding EF-hand superfamily protein
MSSQMLKATDEMGLTVAEKSHLRRKFEAIDVDGSGSLDVDEFKSAIERAFGEHPDLDTLDMPSDDILQEEFDKCDTDGNGTIELEEFYAVFAKIKRGEASDLMGIGSLAYRLGDKVIVARNTASSAASDSATSQQEAAASNNVSKTSDNTIPMFDVDAVIADLTAQFQANSQDLQKMFGEQNVKKNRLMARLTVTQRAIEEHRFHVDDEEEEKMFEELENKQGKVYLENTFAEVKDVAVHPSSSNPARSCTRRRSCHRKFWVAQFCLSTCSLTRFVCSLVITCHRHCALCTYTTRVRSRTSFTYDAHSIFLSCVFAPLIRRTRPFSLAPLADLAAAPLP